MTKNSHNGWICANCGYRYGRAKAGTSTDYCKEEKEVTVTRDFGYPPLPTK